MFTCCPNWASIGCCCGKHGGLVTHCYPYLLRLPTLSEKPATQKAVALRCQHNSFWFFFYSVVNRWDTRRWQWHLRGILCKEYSGRNMEMLNGLTCGRRCDFWMLEAQCFGVTHFCCWDSCSWVVISWETNVSWRIPVNDSFQVGSSFSASLWLQCACHPFIVGDNFSFVL